MSLFREYCGCVVLSFKGNSTTGFSDTIMFDLVTRGEVGHGYHHFFLRLIFPHFYITVFSINSLQLLSFAVVLHSPPTLSRSLFAQSSHPILALPHLPFLTSLSSPPFPHLPFLTSLFPPLSGHLISASFSSPIIST